MEDWIDENFTAFLSTVVNGISALACLYLIYKFLVFPRRLWIRIIFILVISDLVTHISQIYANFANNNDHTGLLIEWFAFNIMNKLSVFWALVIAYFLHKVIKQKYLDNQRVLNQSSQSAQTIQRPPHTPSEYLSRALVLMLIISIVLTVGYYFSKKANNVVFALLSGEFPLLTSISLGIFLYFKTVTNYKYFYGNEASEDFKNITKALLSYALIQVVTNVPIVVYNAISSIFDFNNDLCSFITALLLSTSGFADSLFYFLNKTQLDETSSSPSSPDIDFVSLTLAL